MLVVCVLLAGVCCLCVIGVYTIKISVCKCCYYVLLPINAYYRLVCVLFAGVFVVSVHG